MNQKKSTQLRKMAEIYLNRQGTKYLTKAQYRAKKKPTIADDRLLSVYNSMSKQAKRNYLKQPIEIKQKLGKEWVLRIKEEY